MKRELRLDNREPDTIVDYFVKLKRKYDSLVDVELKLKQLLVSDVNYEDDDRFILVERKAILDAVSSIYDGRIYEQIKKMDEFTIDGKELQKFLILTGEWKDVASFVERMKAKGKEVNKYTFFSQIAGVIKDFLKKGILTIVLPDDVVLVDFILKIIEDKEPDYEFGSGKLSKGKKKVDRFALSMMALVERLGRKKAKIISKHYHSYNELRTTNALSLSNLIRKELGDKEAKKPMEKIVELFTYV